MSLTTIEKILEKHSDAIPRPGEIVWVDIDFRSARDFGGANVIRNLQKNYDGDFIADKSRTAFTFDTNAPANTIGYAENQHFCRTFARKYEIPLYDVNQGIGTHVAIDNRLVLPGDTAVGTDSHYNIMGAIGAFGQGMGDQDIAFIFKTGKTWFKVPETIRVEIEGIPLNSATARDLTLKIVGTLGTDKSLGKAVEIYGEAVDRLDFAGRITLASMATETGAISFFIKPDEKTLERYRKKGNSNSLEPVWADENPDYADVITIDVEGVGPQVALPPSPVKVVDLKEARGRPIDSVFLGSCTNGRYEDFMAATDILKGKRIKSDVMFKAVPATREIFQRLLNNHAIADLFEAGVIISQPGCGGCASGQLGMTGKGEVQLSTSNRNFPGKQGAGDTYLVSPETAAYSALEGVIANPKA